MKKEDLLDLLEELRPDDEYIEEALTGRSDGQGEKVYAGKTHITPLKVIAPIAACLAVIIGAKFAITKLGVFSEPYSESGAVESTVTSDIAVMDIGAPTPKKLEFLAKCEQIVAEECERVSQGEIVWNARTMNLDLYGTDELLLYPQIDGATVDGVGVRVFRSGYDDEIIDLGSFGEKSDSIDLNAIYKDPYANPQFYYYHFVRTDGDKRYDRVQKINYSFSDERINAQTILEKITVDPDGSALSGSYKETYSRYGDGMVMYISRAEFLQYARAIPHMEQELCAFPGKQIEECESYLLSQNGLAQFSTRPLPDDLWKVNELDINEDGNYELLLSMYDYVNLNGVFVFGKNDDGGVVYLGSFDTEEGLCDPEKIERYNESDGRFWYYGSRVAYTEEAINRIVAGKDGFSTEKILTHIFFTATESESDVFLIGENEVTRAEYDKESSKYRDISFFYGNRYDLNAL